MNVLEARRLYLAKAISAEAAGILLRESGVQMITVHPFDADHNGDAYNGRESWRDASGRVWPLYIKGEGATITDSYGFGWHWAGGFAWVDFIDNDLGGIHPLMSRDDWSEEDVPLCYVEAVCGPLQVEGREPK